MWGTAEGGSNTTYRLWVAWANSLRLKFLTLPLRSPLRVISFYDKDMVFVRGSKLICIQQKIRPVFYANRPESQLLTWGFGQYFYIFALDFINSDSIEMGKFMICYSWTIYMGAVRPYGTPTVRGVRVSGRGRTVGKATPDRLRRRLSAIPGRPGSPQQAENE